MEPNWAEMSGRDWSEAKRTERNCVLLWGEIKTYILTCVIRLHLPAANNISWIETAFSWVLMHCLLWFFFSTFVWKKIKLLSDWSPPLNWNLASNGSRAFQFYLVWTRTAGCGPTKTGIEGSGPPITRAASANQNVRNNIWPKKVE